MYKPLPFSSLPAQGDRARPIGVPPTLSVVAKASRLPLVLFFVATAALARPAAAATEAPAPAAVTRPAVPDLLAPPVRFSAEVSDPLLADAPRAPMAVDGWDEALRLLRETSTDDRSAQAGVERAQGRWQQALSSLLPNARLSASVGIDVLNPSRPTSGSTGGGFSTGGGLSTGDSGDWRPTAPLGVGTVSVTQSLVDVGAWRGLNAAKAGERGAEQNLRDVRRRLTQGLSRSLVAVVAAERAAELNRLGLRQSHERAALTRRTLELGAATQLDLLRVQQDLEAARSAVIAGDEQLRRTRDALGLALGQTHEVGVSPAFQFQQLVEQAQAQCRPVPSVDERPDLLAQQAQLDAARASREQASAGYLPTLGLQTSASAMTTDPGPMRVPTWSLSAVLSVPLWEGGLRQGLVQERAGAEQQAAETLEQTRRSVSIEVARARRNVEVAEALLRTAREGRELAANTDRLTQRSFEVGRSTSLELVQSAVALRQADLNLVAREFDWVQARLDAFLTEATCDW